MGDEKPLLHRGHSHQAEEPRGVLAGVPGGARVHVQRRGTVSDRCDQGHLPQLPESAPGLHHPRAAADPGTTRCQTLAGPELLHQIC